ncbi:pyridoxamine 5'-phosphate oxidase [bacterium]|nr:pyridoxamine 5'-phosphate oxidase [bacterium]
MTVKNPFEQFEIWFEEAKKCEQILLPEAMSVTTVDKNGFPDSRMVLLKGFNENGFVFYTNLLSEKGNQLKNNPFTTLLFYWQGLERQVRILGKVTNVSPKEADSYFKTRPRGSQIGACVSNQSEVLTSREELEKAFSACEKKFEGKKIPRPVHWSGFRVEAQKIEFWQGKENRLHERLLFTKTKNETWETCLLYP